MKAKKIAKRLRVRARELRQIVDTLHENGDHVAMDRGLLIMAVLQEVAEQVSPRSKKRKSKRSKTTAVKIARPSTNNDAQHEPQVGVGG